MKTFLISIICLFQIALHAQDTIYKRSGEIISAKVLEVNIKDISYYRFDLLSGPLFIVNKNEIKKIRYATGTIDSFAIIKSIPPRQVVMKTTMYLPTNPNDITNNFRRGFYQFQGHTISDRNVIILALEKNLNWKNAEIDLQAKNYRRNKIIQCSIGLGGVALGVAGLYGSAIALSFGSSTYDNMIIGTVGTAFAGILVSTQIVSFQYKSKRLKNTDKITELYNSLSKQ